MSIMFDVYYKAPRDLERGEKITGSRVHRGGKLSFREPPPESENGSIVLTHEFGEFETAKATASLLRQQGEQVEGPVDYGNS